LGANAISIASHKTGTNITSRLDKYSMKQKLFEDFIDDIDVEKDVQQHSVEV